jgi:hypothetical protein
MEFAQIVTRRLPMMMDPVLVEHLKQQLSTIAIVTIRGARTE